MPEGGTGGTEGADFTAVITVRAMPEGRIGGAAGVGDKTTDG